MSNVPAAVLWDMDGTLVDTEPYWFAAEHQLVESFGNTWSEEHAHAVVGFDLLDTAAYIIEHGGVDLAPRDVVCLLYTSPSPRDRTRSRMPSSA